MSDIPTPDYQKIVRDAGLPTTKEEWRAILLEEINKENVTINNNSLFSPFWRLIEGAILNVTTFIINKFLIGTIMPNSFLVTATGDALDQRAFEVDLSRKQATKTRGTLTFFRAQQTGPSLIIAAGTVVQSEPINGITYRVLVLEDTTLAEDQASVEVTVEAENAGAAHNLGGGHYSILTTAIAGISHAINGQNWIDQAGQDNEQDDQLRLRIRNQWLAVGRWHIDATYRSLLSEQSGISQENIFFLHDAPRGPGTANAYILLDTGNPSDELIQSLNDYINNNEFYGHGDDLRVLKLPETMHDVRLNIWYQANLLAEQLAPLEQNISNFIRAAFRENTDYENTRTRPNQRFSFSKLASEIHDHFPEVASVDFLQPDIINGLEIARINTLTINFAVTRL